MTDPESSIVTLARRITALEAQRALLGDAAVDAALAALRGQLAEHQAAVPRRRLVSVLFLDVVGSTAMSQTLDPEDVHDIMDSALQAFSTRVVALGGKVLQYAGDSLLAVFGAEASREDDAERAVHAGLALLAEAQTQAARVLQRHGQAVFGVRVGVHTGHVLLGGGVDEEGSIRGFTVNIAARLEQEALPGSLRISHDTWRHVRGVFDVAAQPPLLVKGHDEPLRTYLVSGARPRAFRVPTRGIDGVETPLVGRDAELGALVEAFESTLTTRGLQAVTVLAEAGLGKSRLIHELQHRLEMHPKTFWMLLGRAQPGSSLQPYGLLRDIFSWRLQIADSDSAEVARRKLVEGVAPLFAADGIVDGQTQAELLGQLIGMDFSASPRLQPLLTEPRLLRDRALAGFADYLRRLAASDGSSVVLLLDDLQWADDASLDWLQQLMTADDLPLTLVMGARPTLLERRANWGAPPARHQRITLAALDARQRGLLTHALLSRLPGEATALHSLIETQAEGNPFYAEELLKMLIDEGVIVVDGDRWHLHADRLRSAQVPGTLTGVLQARIDALAGPERRALQLASIVGPVFWDAALSALDASAPQALPALHAKAMVQAHADSAFANAREEGFHHHLLHQVTYDTVLKAERRTGHARAAQWLAERVGDREAEYLAVTAEHYDRAGDAARATEWYWKAESSATNGYAYATSVAYLRRLQALIEPADAHQRFKICKHLSFIGGAIGDPTLQAEATRDGSALAEKLDDDAMRAWVYSTRALMADRRGDRVEAGAMATRAVECAERSGNVVNAALGHGELAWLASERGAVEIAREHIERGLVWARRAAAEMASPSDDMYEMQLLLVLAQSYRAEHDYAMQAQISQRALALAERSRHRRTHAYCHSFLGESALALGDLARAESHIEQFEALGRLIGVTTLLAQAHELRAVFALAAGDFAAAAADGQTGAAGYARIGSVALQARSLGFAAEGLCRGGDAAAARAVWQLALELHELANEPIEVSVCRLQVADALRAEGDLAGALARVRVEQAMLAADSVLNTSDGALGARFAAWRVLQAAGAPEAADQLAQTMAELTRRTAKITDPAAHTRALAAWPLHRDVIAAWAVRDA